MELTEGERIGSLFLLLLLIFCGWLVFYIVSLPEHMAKEGYTPYRLPGDATVYWYTVPTPLCTLQVAPEGKSDALKGKF